MIKKHFSLLFLILVVLLSASCSNNIDFTADTFQTFQEFTQTSDNGTVFHATIEDYWNASATKVFADRDMRVLWNANDCISIFNKTTGNQQFQFTGKDGDNAGDFGFVSGSPSSTKLNLIYALYPYSPSTTISEDGIISLMLPGRQTYIANSFGIGANTMLSVSDDGRLLFRNVGGYLSFKFYGDGVSITSITLKGNNGEKLAGEATTTMSVDGTPDVQMKTTADEEITLVCEMPVALGVTNNSFTEFWFVIPPTLFSKGLTVSISDSEGKTIKLSTSNSISVLRNTLSRMAPIEVLTSSYPEGVGSFDIPLSPDDQMITIK